MGGGGGGGGDGRQITIHQHKKYFVDTKYDFLLFFVQISQHYGYGT